MTFIIKRNDSAYFETFCGDIACSWIAYADCAMQYDTQQKAYNDCKKNQS